MRPCAHQVSTGRQPASGSGRAVSPVLGHALAAKTHFTQSREDHVEPFARDEHIGGECTAMASALSCEVVSVDEAPVVERAVTFPFDSGELRADFTERHDI